MKTPAELARAACIASRVKGNLSIAQMLLMGILAGAYIAFAGWLMTVVSHDMPQFSGSGFTRFLSGVVFSTGLIFVVISGSELFTGNCMMPLGYLAGYTPLKKILRNWGWVYFANLLGSILIAALIFFSGLADNAVGGRALQVASDKMSLPFLQAFCRGILCNWIVVLAVWMSMAADNVIGKIWAIFFPIMAFIASGFEHSVANMYYMSLALMLKGTPAAVAPSGLSDQAMAVISPGGFFGNLIPVTLGNIVGGVLFVAIFYYFIFRDSLADLREH
ncbi:MAG: formate/nitrite transporter family protein [Aminivibrio sp.]|jgi:formate/nitrite transporter